MANTPISMSKLRQVLKLHLRGRSKLRISQMTCVSRNTVTKYVTHLQRLGMSAADLEQRSDLQLEQVFNLEPPAETDPRVAILHAFIECNDKRMRKRGMTHSRLFEDYHQQHPDGFSTTAFYRHYRLWSRRTKPSMHLEHKAGDKMFVDFTGEKLPMIDPQTGELVYAECFVAILPASQLTYVQAVASQRVEDFNRCCENALYYFGGAPAAMVPDNLKSAVIKADKYEPTLNDNYEAFADHFGRAVVPARAYRPKDKAHVEKQERSIKNAHFRYKAMAELIDFSSERQQFKNQILRLTDCSFIGKQENVLITGSTSLGKSYIASAIGHQACTLGYRVLYEYSNKLFARLKLAKADGSYIKDLARIERQDLLILDDFGIQPLDAQSRAILMEVIEDRHGKRSTLFTSEVPVHVWHEVIGEQTVSDAILDRIIHDAHRLELAGDSLRKRKSDKLNQSNDSTN